jgi:hypothetical protein
MDYYFFGVFTGTASILGYLIFILRLGNILIFLIKYFLNLSNQFIKKVQQYFRVFRILTMLFILFKFILIYDLLIYCFFISTVILLGFAFYRYRSAFTPIITQMSLTVFISSDENEKKIIVYQDNSTREMTNFNTVETKFEFNLSDEKIQEISNRFGQNVINHRISGQNANQIVEIYVMPLIESSKLNSLFMEILNQLS